MSHAHQHHRNRRGSVVIIVLWTIAVAAILISSVQLFAYRQATMGREALDRIQARWAARAGIEQTISVMQDHTERPYPDDAKAMVRDMYFVATGSTLNATYDIVHHANGKDWGGPMDEHSKVNINSAEGRSLLQVLEHITFDVADAINDWIDEDNDANVFGVERDYYLSLDGPYKPRNGPMRSLGEIELIAGIFPKDFRGEDWNLNFRLDPNENDGSLTFPPDEPDEVLDGAWSSHVTTYSVAGGASGTGLPRIYLGDTEIEELMERLGVDQNQARSLIEYGKRKDADLGDFIFPETNDDTQSTGGRNIAVPANQEQEQQTNSSDAQYQGLVRMSPVNLTDEQLRLLLSDTTTDDPIDRLPGKMNVNSISEDLLRDILDVLGLDQDIADEVIYMRESRPEGIVSILDLREIPNITSEELRMLGRRFDTVSNVFTICSRGRSEASGLEVEIIAVVDRSTVPTRILEYREQ